MCGGGRTFSSSSLSTISIHLQKPNTSIIIIMYLQRLKTVNCKACLSCHQCNGYGFSRSDASRSTTLSPVRHDSRPRLTLEIRQGRLLLPVKLHSVIEETQGGILDEEDEDDDLCPVECVKEFKTDEEFLKILEKAKDTLVVVDFYRTSCGSCKYIEQGFSKLCKRAGDEDAGVIFLKHNVIDEYDEESEVADRLRIRAVPLFHFYKNGLLLEAFPTRDKERITAAILKYSTPSPPQQP